MPSLSPELPADFTPAPVRATHKGRPCTAPANLVGHAFHDLVVIAPAGRTTYGNRGTARWLCRCACGATLTVPALKLYGQNQRACDACQVKGRCSLCSVDFSRTKPQQTVCSTECRRELKRTLNRASAARRPRKTKR